MKQACRFVSKAVTATMVTAVAVTYPRVHEMRFIGGADIFPSEFFFLVFRDLTVGVLLTIVANLKQNASFHQFSPCLNNMHKRRVHI